MTQISKLLSRLDGVVEITPERWKALCPAHNDKKPSLSIRVSDSDKILIKCWTGCGSASVLEAVGLEFSDLMPNSGSGKSGRQNHWHTMREGYKVISKEGLIIAMAANYIVSGKGLSVEDVERVNEAARNIRLAIAAIV